MPRRRDIFANDAADSGMRFWRRFVSALSAALESSRGLARLPDIAADAAADAGPLIYDLTVSSQLLGASAGLARLPAGFSGNGNDSRPPINLRDYFYGPDNQPGTKFPIINEVSKRMADAVPLRPETYYAIAANAREKAFTVSGELSDDARAIVGKILSENVNASTDRQQFIAQVESELPNVLTSARIEQVFRNNVLAAYSDGTEKALTDPGVVTAFPFRAYYAIHDRRARPEHRALERLGLNGTNVYFFDDPVWNLFRPPWDWNCRCGFTPLTIRQAAAKNVAAAIEWLETGRRPPTESLYVPPPDFLPDPRWRRL